MIKFRLCFYDWLKIDLNCPSLLFFAWIGALYARANERKPYHHNLGTAKIVGKEAKV
tara:strand:- start:183 stop:353 length:171 start_codon:yes stop_codon:yes gene_type:complete